VFKRPREASEGARRVSRHGKARAHAREEREATLIAKGGLRGRPCLHREGSAVRWGTGGRSASGCGPT
jgi:hypothetical protein